MPFQTADLCDEHGDKLQVAEPVFRDYGGRAAFCGPIKTVRACEDNSRVREALEEPGEASVLVVDGAGSLRCAMLGDQLAALAHQNGWQGIVIYGAIRDSVEIATIDVGVKALATNPRRSAKRGEGTRDIPVSFAGVRFVPGSYLYADQDGIVVSSEPLNGD